MSMPERPDEIKTGVVFGELFQHDQDGPTPRTAEPDDDLFAMFNRMPTVDEENSQGQTESVRPTVLLGTGVAEENITNHGRTARNPHKYSRLRLSNNRSRINNDKNAGKASRRGNQTSEKRVKRTGLTTFKQNKYNVLRTLIDTPLLGAVIQGTDSYIHAGDPKLRTDREHLRVNKERLVGPALFLSRLGRASVRGLRRIQVAGACAVTVATVGNQTMEIPYPENDLAQFGLGGFAAWTAGLIYAHVKEQRIPRKHMAAQRRANVAMARRDLLESAAESHRVGHSASVLAGQTLLSRPKNKSQNNFPQPYGR